jgi:ABC-type branched-subunit amino acid transport system substrate-binding protein
MRRKGPIGLLVAVLCAVAVAACGGSSKNTTSTASSPAAGTINGFTGSVATTSAATTNASNSSPITFALISYSTPGADSLTELNIGASAAVASLNAKGGFGGRHINLITCNSMLVPTTATVCAHKTLAQHPIAEFGCELAWSASGLAIYAAAQVPSINCLNDPVDYHNPWSFGVVGGTIGQNGAMAKYLCTRSDVHNVANLFPDVPDYHTVVFPLMQKIFGGCGKTTTVTYYPLTAVDPGPYAVKVAALHPDFVNFTGIGGQAVTIFKSLAQNGIPATKVATTDVDFTDKLINSANGAMDGMYLEAQFTPWGVTSDPEVAKYVSDVKAQGADPNDPSVEWGYAYIMFLYTAAQHIGFANFNSATLKNWLDTANGIHIPLSQNMNNPGPAGYPQLKQPYERILQFKVGTTFVVIPTGPAKDGWVNAFS